MSNIPTKAEVAKHLLFINGKQVDYRPSPNVGGAYTPLFLVLHYTADTNPQSTIGWFQNPVSKVSAHLLIDREGNVTQFAPFSSKCQHAGDSEWKGYQMLNGYSIGIELTNAGLLMKDGKKHLTLNRKQEVKDAVLVDGIAWQPYTPIQIEVLKAVSDALVAKYSLREIVGHSDISPQRKIDPGKAFPWKFFKTDTIMPAKTITATTSNVNIRVDPSKDFAPIQVLPQGAQVVDLGFNKNGFTYVKVNETLKGWVSSEYIEVTK